MMRIAVLVVAAAILSSCGPLNKGSPVRSVVDFAIDRVNGADEPEQPLVTPELVEADEILFATLRRQGVLLPMTKATKVGSVETWITAAGPTIALENGIVVATRGLGFDLSGADPIGTTSAIAQGGGSSQRMHGFINTLDQIDKFTLSCEVAQVGPEDIEMPRGLQTLTKFEESCSGRRLVFKNEYWTDDSGEIVRSLQMVSPQLGFVLLEKA